jgi:DNA-binding HxlR family transcriptional regulator
MAMGCCCPGGCGNVDCVQLTPREAQVCITLCKSAVPMSFTQLKESLGLHQEVLSRVVRRLTVHGLVAKVEGKYQGRCGQ